MGAPQDRHGSFLNVPTPGESRGSSSCRPLGGCSGRRSASAAWTGPYSYVRHPQYLRFIVIMLGFLVMRASEFKHVWQEYGGRTPRWLPRPGSRRRGAHAETQR